MAEDVKLVLRYRVEANAPLAYQKPILLMEGDKRANVLQVSLFDGEKPVDVTGLTVGGSVLRADGADVAIEGEIDGNVISCVLSEYAYAVAGPFKAYVQLLDSLGDVKRTVLLLAGMVESRGHGPQIDTGKELPSLDDILAQLETMRNVTQAANTAAGDANTAASAANSAASNATGAANSATTAAGTANAAADRANNAAQNWEEGTAANSSLLANKPPEYYLTPVNLLDNSDFTNPVNQRWYTSGKELAGWAYFFDRWELYQEAKAAITFSKNGVSINQITIAQVLENVPGGKVYTGAIGLSDGTVICASGLVTYSADNSWIRCAHGTDAETKASVFLDTINNTFNFVIYTYRVATIEWAALYEGAYTSETLPPHIPKGYATELAECQRYFWRCNNTYFVEGVGYAFNASTFRIAITSPQTLRDKPTMTADNGDEINYGIQVCVNSGAATTPTSASVSGTANNRILLTLSGTYNVGELGVLRLTSALNFSADL